jgi:hypothetical protein
MCRLNCFNLNVSSELFAGPSVRQPLSAGQLRPRVQGALRLLQRRTVRSRERTVPLPARIPGTKGVESQAV